MAERVWLRGEEGYEINKYQRKKKKWIAPQWLSAHWRPTGLSSCSVQEARSLRSREADHAAHCEAGNLGTPWRMVMSTPKGRRNWSLHSQWWKEQTRLFRKSGACLPCWLFPFQFLVSAATQPTGWCCSHSGWILNPSYPPIVGPHAGLFLPMSSQTCVIHWPHRHLWTYSSWSSRLIITRARLVRLLNG